MANRATIKNTIFDSDKKMTCLYGSEPKFPNDSTIVIRPYEDFPLGWQPAMLIAQIPLQYNFSPESICSSAIPSYQEVGILDLLTVNAHSLRAKIENNSQRNAWLKGCVCKPKPVETEPDPDPDPDPVPDPENPPEVPESPNCSTETYGGGNWIIWRLVSKSDGTSVWYRAPVSKPITSIRKEVRHRVDTIAPSSYVPIYQPLYNPFNLPVATLEVLYATQGDDSEELITQSTSSVIRNAKPLTCEGFPDPEEPEPDPDLLDPCELFGCHGAPSEGDCLKLPDRAFIISELKLHTSESNDRIKAELDTVIGGYINTLDSNNNARRDAIIAAINDTLFVIDANAQGYRNNIMAQSTFTLESLVESIESSRDGILAAITASATAIGLGIAASTASILAAITAATAATGTAITASTTAINSALTAAKEALTASINSARDKIIEDTKEEIERNNPELLAVAVQVLTKPTNLSITAGRNGAPDAFKAGWIQFYTIDQGKRRYSSRHFIINSGNMFISETIASKTNYVLHLNLGFTVSVKAESLAIKESN